MDDRNMFTRKNIIDLILIYWGAMTGVYIVLYLNQNIVLKWPLIYRMLGVIASYWIIAFVPILVMARSSGKLSAYGFTKTSISKQVLLGIFAGLIMSFALTLLPHLMGLGKYVDNGRRYQYFWQFMYEFLYCIFAVGAVEEFVFRGLIYGKIRDIFSGEWPAIILSSILFGFVHIFSGNLIQVIATSVLGLIFCLIRLKISGITTLSLIFSHGVYNAMISVWASIFLKGI